MKHDKMDNQNDFLTNYVNILHEIYVDKMLQ